MISRTFCNHLLCFRQVFFIENDKNVMFLLGFTFSSRRPYDLIFIPDTARLLNRFRARGLTFCRAEELKEDTKVDDEA